VETLLEAGARLQESGYRGAWSARAGGVLRCSVCGLAVDAAEVVIDEVVRFEGPSDPGDEAILYALTGPCGDRGLYSSAYGPYASDADREVAGRLRLQG
jgi:hypothetical protein